MGDDEKLSDDEDIGSHIEKDLKIGSIKNKKGSSA